MKFSERIKQEAEKLNINTTSDEILAKYRARKVDETLKSENKRKPFFTRKAVFRLSYFCMAILAVAVTIGITLNSVTVADNVGDLSSSTNTIIVNPDNPSQTVDNVTAIERTMAYQGVTVLAAIPSATSSVVVKNVLLAAKEGTALDGNADSGIQDDKIAQMLSKVYVFVVNNSDGITLTTIASTDSDYAFAQRVTFSVDFEINESYTLFYNVTESETKDNRAESKVIERIEGIMLYNNEEIPFECKTKTETSNLETEEEIEFKAVFANGEEIVVSRKCETEADETEIEYEYILYSADKKIKDQYSICHELSIENGKTEENFEVIKDEIYYDINIYADAEVTYYYVEYKTEAKGNNKKFVRFKKVDNDGEISFVLDAEYDSFDKESVKRTIENDINKLHEEKGDDWKWYGYGHSWK